MDNSNNNSQQSVPFVLSPAQFPKGIIDPGMLAATPVQAKGDFYYSDGANFQRLPIGTSGQVLNVSSGIPAWTSLAPAATYGVVTYKVAAVDGTTTSSGSLASVASQAISAPSSASDIYISANGRFKCGTAADEVQFQLWDNTNSAALRSVNVDAPTNNGWFNVALSTIVQNVSAGFTVQFRWARVVGSSTATLFDTQMNIMVFKR